MQLYFDSGGMRWTISRKRAAVMLLVISLHGQALVGQDFLGRVRSLYERAAYEDALELLDRYEPEEARDGAARTRAVDEYRALCLIALDRTEDAEAVLLRLISSNPLFVPSSADPSPRFLTAVLKVRNHVTPDAVRQLYGEAKAAADRRRYVEATVALEKLLRIAEQPGLEPDVVMSLATVVRDAKDLLAISRRSQTVSQAGDAGVTPPVAVRQLLPDPSAIMQRITRDYTGQLEVIVDSNGAVESAALTTPVHPEYDPLLLNAAKTWTFKPAQQNGHAVPFRTVITVHLTPAMREN